MRAELGGVEWASLEEAMLELSVRFCIGGFKISSKESEDEDNGCSLFRMNMRMVPVYTLSRIAVLQDVAEESASRLQQNASDVTWRRGSVQ